MPSPRAGLKRLVVFGVAAAVLASLLGAAPAAAQVSVFGDVDESAYYAVPVAELAALGVFAGTECDEGFCPDAPIDRKTMAVWTVSVVTGQDPPPVSGARFEDVDADSFYAPFVERMADLGITQGCGDGTNFCPDKTVTRAQMAVFLSRAYSLAAGPDPGFGDVAADAWYASEVASLAASGITHGCGDGTDFCPDQATTRAQMATFLWRAEQRSDDTDGVEVPGDGTAVTVPRGGSFTAELEQVSVDAPAGTLSGQAHVSLSETSVGTSAVPEGEELATAPLALQVTGAEIIRPLTLRFRVDTSSLTPTGVVPAWYSSELGSWVPLDAQSVVIGDGVVTVTANLADTRPVSAATALGPTLYAGAGPLNGPVDAVAHALIAPVVVVGLIFVVTAAAVGVAALTSDVVHDALKRFFGLVASEPVCRGGLPEWVDSLSDSEGSLSGGRARLFSCGESAGDDLVVKVVNNRNYGIEFDAASGMTPVELAGGPLPLSGLDLLVKETAEEVIGGSYLWPLSNSQFQLREQSRDWSGKWRPTGTTAIVDGIRVAIDLLKIAIPGLSLAEVTQQKLLVCVKNLLRQGVKILKGSFNIWNFEDWRAVLTDVARCFVATGGDNSEQANKAREGLKEVNKALRWVSTASSVAKWALTAADAIKDSRRDRAWIRVSVPDDDQDGITDDCDSDRGNDGVTDDPVGRPDLDTDGITDDCDDDRDGDQILDRCESDRNNDGILDRYARDRDNDGILDYDGCDTDIGFSVVGDSRFSAVSAGFFHSCALSTDGTIRCWGYNTDGQADSPDGQFSAVSAGWLHTCALQDLSIDCWGNNDHGQTQVPVGAYTAVSAGSYHSCGLETSGAIRCWGSNSHGQSDAPSGRFTAVSAGDNVSCGVTSDRAVSCWGGAADWSDTTAGPFNAVAAGGTNSCALRTDSTITCRLNAGPFLDAQPEQPVGTFSALSVNESHGCGLATNKTITCWGSNPYGRTDAPQGTYISVSAGYEHSCAVRTDGTITCWGRRISYEQEATATQQEPEPQPGTPELNAAMDGGGLISAGASEWCGLGTDGTITCWPYNYFPGVQAKTLQGTYLSVSAGDHHFCAVRTDNTITCWDTTGLRQDLSNRHGETDAPEGAFTAVAAGSGHSCGLRTDGTITCWGYNPDGLNDAPSGAFNAVTAGSVLSCGLRTDGAITCWGHNPDGRTDAPQGTHVSVSAGYGHACAVRTDNTITCWGNNDDGQTDAPSGAFSAATAAARHSCGLRTDGTISCWGYNGDGQTDAPSGAFSAVTASDGTSCGLRTDGAITCWGWGVVRQRTWSLHRLG